MTAQHMYLQYSLLSIFSLFLNTSRGGGGKQNKEKIPSKIFLDNTPAHLRILIEMYNEINVSFMPSNTTTILQIKEYVWFQVLWFNKYIFVRL